MGSWQGAAQPLSPTSMESTSSLDPLPLITDNAADAPHAGDAPKPFHFDDLKATGQEALKDARHKLEDLLKDGAEYVKANPGKSIVTALGVGFVLGLIFND